MSTVKKIGITLLQTEKHELQTPETENQENPADREYVFTFTNMLFERTSLM